MPYDIDMCIIINNTFIWYPASPQVNAFIGFLMMAVFVLGVTVADS